MSESSERSSRQEHRLPIKCEQCMLELSVLPNEKRNGIHGLKVASVCSAAVHIEPA